MQSPMGDHIKITAIVGTYRKGGIIDAAVDEILSSAREEEAITGKIYLIDKHLEFCKNCRTCTQKQALLTAFFILLPAILLSGFMFPIRNMPEPVQVVTILNPMRWFLQILHGIVVRGVGVTTLWPSILAQTSLCLGFTTLAVVKFRKTLE